MLQFDGSGNLTVRYLGNAAQEQVTSLTSGGTVDWMATDAQGSVRDVVGNTGSAADHIVYATFGQVAYESSTSTPHWDGYAGEHLARGSSLIISGARWYDPTTGRWLSNDPSGFAGHDGNLSRYVGNGPTNSIDPTGLAAQGNWNGGDYSQDTALEQPYAAWLEAQRGPLLSIAPQGSWLDDYGNWVANNTFGIGQAWMDTMGPQIQGVVGNNYLVQASDNQLLAVTAIGATAGVLSSVAALAAATAAGVTGATLWSITGFTGFAYTYVGLASSACLGSNGVAPPPNMGQALNWGWNGYVAGALANSATQLAQGGWEAIMGGNCFVAGTEVIVPDLGDDTRIGALFPDGAPPMSNGESASFWPLFVAAVGIAGYAAARQKSAKDEEKERQTAVNALFGHDSDKLTSEGDGAWPMNSLDDHEYERRIDALCDALFHGDDLLPAVVESVEDHVEWASAPSSLECTPPAKVRRRRMHAPSDSLPTPTVKGHRAALELAPSGRARKRLGLAWLVACLTIAGWLGLRPPAPPVRSTPASMASFGVAMRAPTHASRAIEDIHVGQRVIGENPDVADADHTSKSAVDPATWRLVKLHADFRWQDGTRNDLEIETLQPLAWIQGYQARVGRKVPIPGDLEEFSLPHGMCATVVSIDRCPELEEGPGHLVLTTINQLSNAVYELVVASAAGRQETINTTAVHRFYSDTRRTWVAAARLHIGEELRGVDGPITVAGISRRPGVQRVYNMTVEGEHVYHVSLAGALVHNWYEGELPGGGDEGPTILPFEPQQPPPTPVTPPAYDGPPVQQVAPNTWLVGGNLVQIPPASPPGVGVFQPDPAGIEVPVPPPPTQGYPKLVNPAD